MSHAYISDLDHTLLRSDLSLSGYSAEVWNRMSRQATLSIATARSYKKAVQFLTPLHLNAPLVLLDGSLVVTRKIEHGFARLRGALPLVISVRKELNKPRYTSFTGILDAESKEITVLSNEDLKIPSAVIGIDGSPTKMAGIELRRFERAGEKLDGSVDEIVEALAERIYQYGII